MNYFYIDASGQKAGPVSDEQLKVLAAKGIITAETQLKTESGHKGLAGQIPGLNFPMPTPPLRSINPPSQAGVASNNMQDEALNRQTYILLAVFGGWAGWHCKYAGYQAKQMVHFWLVILGTILLFVFGLGVLLYIVSEIIAVNEMFYEYDASGRRMKE